MSSRRDRLDASEGSGSTTRAMREDEARPLTHELDSCHQEERESAAERRFQLVVEAAPNAMVMVNRAGEICLGECSGRAGIWVCAHRAFG